MVGKVRQDKRRTYETVRRSKGWDGSVGLTGDVRESTSSRNEHEREWDGSVSVGLRGGGRLPRSGGTDSASGETEGSDKRPEVKRREYWWNGMSVAGEVE